MEEVDPVELPDGPPSPLQKAQAGWEPSEQQGETQALSEWGQTLGRGKKFTVALAKRENIITVFVRLNGSC